VATDGADPVAELLEDGLSRLVALLSRVVVAAALGERPQLVAGSGDVGPVAEFLGYW